MKPFYHLVNLFSLLLSLFCSLALNGQIKELVEKQIAIDGELVTYYESIDPTASPTIIDARLSIGEGCATATSVTINGDPVQASLAGATNSGIIPSCATNATIYDIWFSTQADANGYLDIGFDPVGTNSRDFGITIWTNCDGNESNQLACWDSPLGSTSGTSFTPNQLTSNQTIYIQVWTYTPSSQEVLISTASRCGPLFSTTSTGEQICDNETNTYSQAMEVAYYTILSGEINIQIKTRSGTVIYSTPATSNPQMITIPNLPANGLEQEYLLSLDVCSRNYVYRWQAPTENCTYGTVGTNCAAAINLPIDNPTETCLDLNNSDIGTSTPFCGDPTQGAIKSVWVKAVSDNIGSLVFDYNEKNFTNLTVGFAIYDDCESTNALYCKSPLTFTNPFFRFTVPEIFREPNKEWYLQLWTYANQEQEICVKAFPECRFSDVTVGTATCTSEETFNQQVTLSYFNIPDGKIQILDPDDSFSMLYETDIANSPQVITIPNLPTTLTRLYIRSSTSTCSGKFINDLSVPTCTGGSNSCPETLIIDANSDLSLPEHRATTTITTEGDVTMASTTSFKAGTSITLKPGFQVNNGTNFSAIIEDCPNTFTETTKEEIARIAPTSSLSIIKENSLTIYPNPFTSHATIEYHLPIAGKVDLQIVDFMGRQVTILENNTIKDAGSYQYNFQAENLVAGTYFVMLRSEGHYEVKKILALNK